MQPLPGTRIWVVIAAFNEARVIARVVADVSRRGYHVVVVDDGSRDATAESGGRGRRRRGAPSGQPRPGRGAADRHRICAARRARTTSSPSTPTASIAPQDIAGLLDALAKHRADFALGSRFLGASIDLPPSRRLLLKAATLVHPGDHRTAPHRHAQRPARDDAARRAAHRAAAEPDGACLGAPATRSRRARLRYVEVPVTIEYSAYSLAKGQKLSDSLTILVDLSARRLHR